MEPNIISVHSYKGGVGKTTIALSIAAELASHEAQRRKVCLIDFDFAGPSIEFIFLSQLTLHAGKWKKPKLFLPHWFMPNIGSPSADTEDIDNYICRPPRTIHQQKFLRAAIDLILCPPTAQSMISMEYAYQSERYEKIIWERIKDLIYELGEKGYTHIVIDNAPGFRDYSFTLYSMMAGIGSNACPILVSSPALGDIGGIMSQLDGLTVPFNGNGSRLWWIVNFLHGNSNHQEYESLPNLAALAERTRIIPQTAIKILSTAPDFLSYAGVDYHHSLADMCFIKQKPKDWFRAVKAGSSLGKVVKRITESIV